MLVLITNELNSETKLIIPPFAIKMSTRLTYCKSIVYIVIGERFLTLKMLTEVLTHISKKGD